VGRKELRLRYHICLKKKVLWPGLGIKSAHSVQPYPSANVKFSIPFPL